MAKYGFKYWDYIEAPEGTLGGKYPSQRAIAELDRITDDFMQLINAHTARKAREIAVYAIGENDTDDRWHPLWRNGHKSRGEEARQRLEQTLNETKEEE